MSEDTGPVQTPFRPTRRLVDVRPGALVQAGEGVYRIHQLIDFSSLVAVNVETGRSEILRLVDLQPLDTDARVPDPDFAEIADKDWAVAQERFAAIQPLVGNPWLGRRDVAKRAEEVGVDTSTLYRWIDLYREGGAVSALIPRPRGWRAGHSRLSTVVEALIDAVIDDYYLTEQRPTAQKAVEEVQRRCIRHNIAVPSPNSVRSRIARIPERKRLKRRGEKERALQLYQPTPGRFPDADFPLAVVQIDHTPVDVILVDDVYRKPIGRPFLTVAIEVYSRTVFGYYLSFDPPSGASVALCIAQGILPKEDWLLLHKVEAEWPIWGIPTKVHVDNGPDFRAGTLRDSCVQYNIGLEFRPVKVPRYGGHIERLLGTFAEDIHELPGTTFSSVHQKGEYDSDARAVMTFNEFERWLVTLICKTYHQSKHRGLGMTPLRRWEIGIFGNADTVGIGCPPRPSDRTKILLDFLPGIRRTIQRTGVSIDELNYYDEALRHWVGAQDPKDPAKKRQFVFRRDPRDISVVWFYDPDLKGYFRIPFADQSLPAMSIWAYREARARMKAEGNHGFDPRKVADAVLELREQVDASSAQTKAARRQAQRRRLHDKKVSPATPLPPREPPPQPTPVAGLVDVDLDPFGEIA